MTQKLAPISKKMDEGLETFVQPRSSCAERKKHSLNERVVGYRQIPLEPVDENGALEASETSPTDVDGDNAKETSSRSPAMEFQILQWQLKGAKETQRSSSTTVFAGHAAVAPSSKLSFHRIPRMWETKITHNKNTRRKRHLLQVFFLPYIEFGQFDFNRVAWKKEASSKPLCSRARRNLVPKARGNLLLERDLFERNFSSNKKSLWANLSDVGSHESDSILKGQKPTSLNLSDGHT